MELSKLFENLSGEENFFDIPIFGYYRELYYFHKTNTDNLKFAHRSTKVLEDVFIMAVKMDKKMCEYKLGEKEEYAKNEIDDLIKRVKNYKKILKKFNKNRK
jgi:hypothetical protein